MLAGRYLIFPFTCITKIEINELRITQNYSGNNGFNYSERRACTRFDFKIPLIGMKIQSIPLIINAIIILAIKPNGKILTDCKAEGSIPIAAENVPVKIPKNNISKYSEANIL